MSVTNKNTLTYNQLQKRGIRKKNRSQKDLEGNLSKEKKKEKKVWCKKS